MHRKWLLASEGDLRRWRHLVYYSCVKARHKQVIPEKFGLNRGLAHPKVDELEDLQGVDMCPIVELTFKPMRIKLDWEQLQAIFVCVYAFSEGIKARKVCKIKHLAGNLRLLVEVNVGSKTDFIWIFALSKSADCFETKQIFFGLLVALTIKCLVYCLVKVFRLAINNDPVFESGL